MQSYQSVLKQLEDIAAREQRGIPIKPGEKVDLLLRQSGYLKDSYQLEHALHAAQSALKESEGLDAGTRAKCYDLTGRIEWNMSRYLEADKSLSRALEIRRTLGRNRDLLDACKRVGICALSLDEFEKSEALLNEAYALATALDIPREQGDIMVWQGSGAMKQGLYQNALDMFLKALGVFRANELLSLEANCLNNIGLVCHQLKLYDRAMENFKSAMTIHRERNHLHGLADVLNNMGMSCRMMGLRDDSLKYYLEALDLQTKVGFQEKLSNILNNIGVLLLEMDRPSEALGYLRRCLEIRRETGTPYSIVKALAVQVHAFLALDRLDEAEPVVQEMKTVMSGMEHPEILQFPHETLYRFARKRERYLEALEHLERWNEARERSSGHESLERISELLADFKTLELFTEKEKTEQQSRKLIEINKKLRRANQVVQESYEALEQSQKEKLLLEKKTAALAMAATANHEINQPLMILEGNLEMFLLNLDESSLSPRHIQYLDRMFGALERIKTILARFRESRNISTKEYSSGTEMFIFED